jgi:hypothetical protein
LERSAQIGLLLIGLLALAPLGQAFGANPDFEARLRRQLERLFFAEQYFLDITAAPAPGGPTDAEPLPGLAALSALSDGTGSASGGEGNLDILLVLDKSVSRERQKIAEEMVRRQIEAEGLARRAKLTVRQQAMLKVPPAELAPLAARSIDDKAAAAPSPSTGQAPQAADEQTPRTNIFDFIENKRELATRVLLVLWTAIASLVAIGALLGSRRRALAGGQPSATAQAAPQAAAPSSSVNGAGAGAGTPGSPVRMALTKDEIYSKDAALYKLARELVDEAAEAPEKFAGVITRWLEASEENVRYAAVFLKNCDMKTVEKICRGLHPSDAELIVSRDLSDFDPFSDENRKVLGLIRGEVARVAAKHSVKSRPEPLSFLKQLSEEDLARVLAGESPGIVALVATQVPAHRLARYLESLPLAECQAIMDMVIMHKDVAEQDFAEIKPKLEAKIQALGSVLVDDAARLATARQMLSAMGHAARQAGLARELASSHVQTYNAVRRHLLLAPDLCWLPPRAAKLVFQTIDGEVIAAAVGDAQLDWDALGRSMPEAVSEAFTRAVSREFSTDERVNAWRSVQQVIENLQGGGLLSSAELNVAKARTDEQYLATGADAAKASDDSAGSTSEPSVGPAVGAA